MLKGFVEFDPYREAHERYTVIRRNVHESVELNFNSIGVSVRLTEISYDAAKTADSWEYPSDFKDRVPEWWWMEKRVLYRKRPKRLDLAIWFVTPDQDPLLCGLMYGRVSRGKMEANIDLVEKNPNATFLPRGTILSVAVRVLEMMATKLGCERVGISEPDPALTKLYKGLGFVDEKWAGPPHDRKVMVLSGQVPLSQRV